MSDSILTSIKKNLGLEESYTAYDFEVITGINTAFATLNQLGVGPEQGFQIEDAVPTWNDFLGSNSKYNMVKSYVQLRVRLLFDPPQTSYLIKAFQEEVEQFEWRISVLRETTAWIDPDPDVPSDDDEVLILDGGGV